MRYWIVSFLLFLFCSCANSPIESIGEKLIELPVNEIYDSAAVRQKIPELSGITAEVYASLYNLPKKDAAVVKVEEAGTYYILTLKGGEGTSAACEMRIYMERIGKTGQYKITSASPCLGCG